jgi:hypothetical protein
MMFGEVNEDERATAHRAIKTKMAASIDTPLDAQTVRRPLYAGIDPKQNRQPTGCLFRFSWNKSTRACRLRLPM